MAGDGILPLGGLEQHAIVCPATHNCEQEAAEHDRLSSDTYQRLNLALMWWGIGTGLTLWFAPQQPLRMALGCVWRLGWLALLPVSGPSAAALDSAAALPQWQLDLFTPAPHARGALKCCTQCLMLRPSLRPSCRGPVQAGHRAAGRHLCPRSPHLPRDLGARHEPSLPGPPVPGVAGQLEQLPQHA
jgi:hypothetical protein